MAIAKVIFNNGITSTVWMDVTQDTVVSSNLLSGESATRADGVSILGTYVPPSFSTMSSTFTPTETTTTITPATGYDGFSQVKINGISSTYVGTGITRRSAADLTSNGAYITAPIGYYSSAVSKAVATATQTTPGITVNANGLVTATATQTAGYVTAGTKTSTYQITSVTGTTITPTEASQLAVASSRFTKGSVYVGAISSTYVGTGIAQKSSADLIGAVGTTSYTVTAPAGYYSANATKNIAKYDIATPAVSIDNTTGLITATVNQANAGYVPTGTKTSTYQLTVLDPYDITPISTRQLAAASGIYTLGSVYVNAISSTYIGSGIARLSSADLTASGSVVTAPAGYYSANAAKAISAGLVYCQDFSSVINPWLYVEDTGLVSAGFGLTAGLTASITPGYVGSNDWYEGTLNVNGFSSYQLSTRAGATITPTTASQLAVSSAYFTTGSVYVGPIPSAYIIPTGTLNITSNGIYDIASYASVSVSAQGDYYTVYRSLAYGSTLRSTDTGVAAWIGELQNVLSAQFEGQRFSGNFVFSNVKSIYSRAFTRRDTNAFYSVNHSFEFPLCISIYDYAFNNHQSLTTISLPKCESIYGTYAFTSCKDLSFIELSKCTKLSSFTFMSCPNLSYASLPLVTGITWSCFAYDTSLANIYAPEVTGIANGAFFSCTKLMSGSFSKCLYVGSSAFSGCTNLSYLYLGSCSYANTFAFANCSSLSSIGGTNAFTKFEDSTMVGAGLLSISYPLLVSTRLSTFKNMKSLSFAYLPAVSSLYTQTFEGCDVLNTAILSSVSAIGGSYAFRSCYNLLSLYLLGSSVATLGAINNFTSTPLSNYTTSTGGVYGSIYVKASLYDTYIAATNWKTISARFVSMTDAQISAFLSSLG